MNIRPIQKADQGSRFSCGNNAIDAYFAKRAWQHQSDNLTRVLVLEDDSATAPSDRILGFYTLSGKGIETDRVRPVLLRSLPRYPLPVFYVGYFAVRADSQQQGYGRVLMRDAIERCLDGLDNIGAVGVFLDSLDDKSTAFYRKLGFCDIATSGSNPSDSRQPMFLPMATIQAAAARREPATHSVVARAWNPAARLATDPQLIQPATSASPHLAVPNA